MARIKNNLVFFSGSPFFISPRRRKNMNPIRFKKEWQRKAFHVLKNSKSDSNDGLLQTLPGCFVHQEQTHEVITWPFPQIQHQWSNSWMKAFLPPPLIWAQGQHSRVTAKIAYCNQDGQLPHSSHALRPHAGQGSQTEMLEGRSARWLSMHFST